MPGARRPVAQRHGAIIRQSATCHSERSLALSEVEWIEESCDAASKLTPRDPSTPKAFGAQDDHVNLSLVEAARFAAHKFYGPKGAGFLFLRSGLSIQPIMFGGAHENERRPGTENVAAIAGTAAAAEGALRDREDERKREAQLRDELCAHIVQFYPEAQQNGDLAHRLANTLNV